MEKIKKLDIDKLKKGLLNNALLIILGFMLIVVICISPSFISINNITNILRQASTRGILALGIAAVIIIQGTDLSAGRILGCCAAISASLLQATTYASRMYPQITNGLPLFIPLLISIIVAVLFSLLNGFGVAYLHMHAFIVSLGTQLIAFGSTCIYIDSQKGGAQPLSTLDPRYLNLVKGSFNLGFMQLPYLVVYLFICAVVVYILWNKTVFGKNMYAFGGNPAAAAVSGINTKLTVMLVFLVAGVLYGISAFLEAARIGSVTTTVGFNYEFDAMSGCVIGGVSWAGGVGTIPGVLLGVVLLQTINYSLTYLNVNPYLQYIIKGIIIILAVAIDVRKYLEKK
ncbi:ABC transporter permease subunit [Caproiciproducens sp. CPB-2]|uniref:ABC transporter permease subunit n=1 Tax=Caproiciproducens sp. CPB-2 TaxID=3030017 RepID=UPI0023D99ED3|nr:beta-methylgalactoside transporter [Caproiciproducens sp. CPB-2]MDF1494378.1 beta-methylgalactoside transporter [Caproiciproducens sp. CPB-2]